jgi:hypothetical protein
MLCVGHQQLVIDAQRLERIVLWGQPALLHQHQIVAVEQRADHWRIGQRHRLRQLFRKPGDVVGQGEELAVLQLGLGVACQAVGLGPAVSAGIQRSGAMGVVSTARA